MLRWLRRIFAPSAFQGVVEAPPGAGHARKATASPGAVGADIDDKIDALGGKAWGTKEDTQRVDLHLDPARLSEKIGYEAIVGDLLKHMRRVAPGLDIPWMTPRVTVSPLTDAAGQFVEEEGWVKIVIGEHLASKPAAVKAILCHEASHYVLAANGIRRTDRMDNERLTDTAMFVLGLGKLFLAGYRVHGHMEYRRDHRLGYLTDDEYRYLEAEVVRRRSNARSLLSVGDELLRQLMNRLGGDKQKAQRYLEHARRKHPQWTEAQRVEEILRDLARH